MKRKCKIMENYSWQHINESLQFAVSEPAIAPLWLLNALWSNLHNWIAGTMDSEYVNNLSKSEAVAYLNCLNWYEKVAEIIINKS